MKLKIFLLVLGALFLGGGALPVLSQETAVAPAVADTERSVLVSGPAGQITARELEASAEQNVPVEQSILFWGTPHRMADHALNLYAWRALAGDAERAGVEVAGGDAQEPGLARDRALGEAYLERLAQAAMPDEDAVRAYAKSEYTAHPERYVEPGRVHLRHILLRLPHDAAPAQEEAIRAEAEALLRQLRDGADFAELAREHSADPGSAAEGGDLGMVPRGRTVPPFEEAAFGLQEPGQLSEPVRTEFGWHIIELLERVPERQRTLEEVLPELREQLRNRVVQHERRARWDEASADAVVDEQAVQALSARHIRAMR